MRDWERKPCFGRGGSIMKDEILSGTFDIDTECYAALVMDMDGVVTRSGRMAEGVETFPASLLLAGLGRISGLKTALIASADHGALIAERAGIREMFETIVDGGVAADLGLAGKPAPDVLLEVCSPPWGGPCTGDTLDG